MHITEQEYTTVIKGVRQQLELLTRKHDELRAVIEQQENINQTCSEKIDKLQREINIHQEFLVHKKLAAKHLSWRMANYE